MDIAVLATALTAQSDDSLRAAPGVAVGILLVIAAVLWFSPLARWKMRRLTLWLVIAAVACIVLFGYLGIGRTGGGA